jgi:hypothetical protein
MHAKIGDRIIVETERVGMADREGEILEVIESPSGTHFRVRWEDGRESTFWPAAGSARIVPAEPQSRPGPANQEAGPAGTAVPAGSVR